MEQPTGLHIGYSTGIVSSVSRATRAGAWRTVPTPPLQRVSCSRRADSYVFRFLATVVGAVLWYAAVAA